ncbi:MAG TPA: HD domain-containing phosphohydrolase [Anaerolineae bacterium]
MGWAATFLKRWSPQFKIAALYALVGGTWILFSDRLLAMFVTDVDLLTEISTFKGWGYVLVTAAILYWLIDRNFTAIQNSQRALQNSYNATLEGWARALDLRDKETENHTQRVTQLALQVAQRMGVSSAKIEHMRRGARLHDIGKMGIPDRILLKPDKLTDTEWTIMRQHPSFAYDLLSPIAYLHSAMEIPYCHHEKWDGSGYPRGLHGEQIPLSARIFAVVDVWDALCSDRPYRPAWTHEQALEYIKSSAGAHFDPRVVEAFLSTLHAAQIIADDGRVEFDI